MSRRRKIGEKCNQISPNLSEEYAVNLNYCLKCYRFKLIKKYICVRTDKQNINIVKKNTLF